MKVFTVQHNVGNTNQDHPSRAEELNTTSLTISPHKSHRQRLTSSSFSHALQDVTRDIEAFTRGIQNSVLK